MDRMSYADYERVAVDANALVIQLLLGVMPVEVEVLEQPSSAPKLPLVVIRCSNGQDVENGNAGLGAWRILINAEIIAYGRDICVDTADMVHRALHTFSDEGIYLPGLGGVGMVETQHLPRIVTTTRTSAGDMVQMNGTWRAILRLQEN